MIHAVLGELVSTQAQLAVLRTAGGIEFSLIISSQSASRLSQLTGDRRRQVRLLTYLQHRDDSMTLYGFIDEEERMLFQELIKVNGIGPRQAIRILSGVQVRAFIQALDENNLSYLSSIPGIGVKTSQKIILALRDTIVVDKPITTTNGGPTGIDRRFDDLVAALSDMGYDKRQVITTLSSIMEEQQELLATKSLHETEEYLFKQAIIRLG
jgi:Holliday junction DNA helicase RuvA